MNGLILIAFLLIKSFPLVVWLYTTKFRSSIFVLKPPRNIFWTMNNFWKRLIKELRFSTTTKNIKDNSEMIFKNMCFYYLFWCLVLKPWTKLCHLLPPFFISIGKYSYTISSYSSDLWIKIQIIWIYNLLLAYKFSLYIDFSSDWKTKLLIEQFSKNICFKKVFHVMLL